MIRIVTDEGGLPIVGALLEYFPDASVSLSGGADAAITVTTDTYSLATVDGRDPVFAVETVSLEGRIVVADVAELKYRSDGRTLAARISVDPSSDLGRSLIDSTLNTSDPALAQAGVATTRLLNRGGDQTIVETVAGLPLPLPPADVAFAAWGLSAQHLLAESFARPTEFLRRADHSRRRRRCLAVVWLDDPGRVTALGGMVDVRRLPYFHSTSNVPSIGNTYAGGASVSFVGEDRPTLRQSVDVLLEMEDAGRVFGPPLVTLALDPRGLASR